MLLGATLIDAAYPSLKGLLKVPYTSMDDLHQPIESDQR